MRTQLFVVLALLAGCGASRQISSGGGDTAPTTGGASPSKGGSSGEATPTAEQQLTAELSPWLDKLVGSPFGTAAVIAASNEDASVALALGTLKDGGAETKASTRFNVASVSKLVTAARVVRMASEGALSLDDPLSLRLPGVSVVDAEGIDRSKDITVQMLLSHTSGLPKFPPDLEKRVAGQWMSPDLLQTLTSSWSIRLAQKPGTYAYSNLGYALLGAIIERIGGCTFADCMAPELTALGMNDATFWPADLDKDIAHGRIEPTPGNVEFYAPNWYGSRYGLPFTGLWTSMPDLRAFGRALVDASKDPRAPLHAMTQGQGHRLGVAHGERLGTTTLEHDGGAAGFYAWLIVVPQREIVVAVAVNGGNERRDEINAFRDIVEGALDATAP